MFYQILSSLYSVTVTDHPAQTVSPYKTFRLMQYQAFELKTSCSSNVHKTQMVLLKLSDSNSLIESGLMTS